MADKELPYSLVRKVLATSTAARYGKLSLARISSTLPTDAP